MKFTNRHYQVKSLLSLKVVPQSFEKHGLSSFVPEAESADILQMFDEVVETQCSEKEKSQQLQPVDETYERVDSADEETDEIPESSQEICKPIVHSINFLDFVDLVSLPDFNPRH